MKRDQYEGFDLIELPRDIGDETATGGSLGEFQIIPNGMQFAETEFRRSTATAKVRCIQRFSRRRILSRRETCSAACQSPVGMSLYFLAIYIPRVRIYTYRGVAGESSRFIFIRRLRIGITPKLNGRYR